MIRITINHIKEIDPDTLALAVTLTTRRHEWSDFDRMAMFAVEPMKSILESFARKGQKALIEVKSVVTNYGQGCKACEPYITSFQPLEDGKDQLDLVWNTEEL